MNSLCRFVLIVAISNAIVFGQEAGAGNRGGSLRLEKPEAAHRENLKTLAARYRHVVQLLDLNFTELTDEYATARKDNPKLKFETVITAYLAAEHQSPSSETDYGKAVVRALKPANNSLALALQRVFSLTTEQAKSRADEAVESYKQADRQTRQH